MNGVSNDEHSTAPVLATLRAAYPVSATRAIPTAREAPAQISSWPEASVKIHRLTAAPIQGTTPRSPRLFAALELEHRQAGRQVLHGDRHVRHADQRAVVERHDAHDRPARPSRAPPSAATEARGGSRRAAAAAGRRAPRRTGNAACRARCRRRSRASRSTRPPRPRRRARARPRARRRRAVRRCAPDRLRAAADQHESAPARTGARPRRASSAPRTARRASGLRVSPAGTGTTSKPCAANSAMKVAAPRLPRPGGRGDPRKWRQLHARHERGDQHAAAPGTCRP